jgi:lysozyme
MNLDLAAELCRKFEGFRANPYLCPAGVPTIGFGSTYYADGRKVTLQDAPITKEEADVLLMHELQTTYAAGVIRLCPGLVSHEGRFNAVVDFCYNLGVGRLQTSTLRRKINAQDWEGAVEQLLLWNKAGGRILLGLERRRQAEAVLMR